jgi:hypothetical protein
MTDAVLMLLVLGAVVVAIVVDVAALGAWAAARRRPSTFKNARG